MSAREMRRGEVLSRVKRGELKLTEAAELLDDQLSPHQADLEKRYAAGGTQASACTAMSGRESNRAEDQRKFASEVLRTGARDTTRASRTSASGRLWRPSI